MKNPSPKNKPRKIRGISGSGLRLLARIESGKAPKRFRRFEGLNTGHKLGRAYE